MQYIFLSLWFITAHKMDFTVAYDIVSKLLQVLNICKFILECLHITCASKFAFRWLFVCVSDEIKWYKINNIII